MPSVTPPTELDQLVALIAAQPDGLGIDAIAKLQGNRLTRRTLQRRLALLAKQGRIQMLGEARAVRYVCTSQANKGFASIRAPTPTLQATGEVYVPVSPEGEEIKAYVRQPRAMRAPVGYRLAFLEQYHPNHTAYLPTHQARPPRSAPGPWWKENDFSKNWDFRLGPTGQSTPASPEPLRDDVSAGAGRQ